VFLRENGRTGGDAPDQGQRELGQIGHGQGELLDARLVDGAQRLALQALARKGVIELLPENPDYQVIVVEPGEPFEIEGLAVGLILNTMLM
jgi:hypothetical protein